MKARGVLLCLVVGLGAHLAFAGGAFAKPAPPAAAAKPGHFVLPGYISVEISLGKDNGYSLELINFGRKHVLVIAHRGTETVAYAAPGHVSSRRVAANFGRFGRIDLRFHPNRAPKRARRPQDPCTGRDTIEQSGTYSGRIRFHDPGVVTVNSRRTFGFFERRFRMVCKTGPRRHRHRKPKPDLEFEVKLLSARKQTGNETLAFEAATLSLGGKHGLELSFVSGSLLEDFGRVIALRSTTELAEEGDVVFSPRGKHPERVRVKGTPPFAGSATYLEIPGGSPSWTGDLSVPLPGQGRVALTGDGFDAEVCRILSLKALGKCDPSASAQRLFDSREEPALPYGSGSHSQPLAEARLSSLR